MTAPVSTKTPVHQTMSTFTGIEYLMMDVASQFGFDKKNWSERLAWTRNNEPAIMEMLDTLDTDPNQLHPLLQQAEEPAMFYAACQALRRVRKGQPTGYGVSFDATSSGLQLLAVLSGCEDSARLSNVIPSSENQDNREDAYTTVYHAQCERLGDEDQKGRVTRAQSKDALMTALYGSRKVPRNHFGEGTPLLQAFYDTVEDLLPGSWQLNLALESLWQSFAPSHDWVLPDNFHVHIKEMNTEQHTVNFLGTPTTIDITVNKGTRKGRSLSPNIVHSIDGMVVRELQRRCQHDPEQVSSLKSLVSDKRTRFGTGRDRSQDEMVDTLWALYQFSGFLSVRIIDYLDDRNLAMVDRDVIEAMLDTLPDKPFDVIAVHDSFRCHPNYGNDLRASYNRILSDMAKSDMLSFIVSQVKQAHTPVTKGDDFSDRILASDYALS